MQTFKANVGVTRYAVELDNGGTLFMNPYDVGIINRYKVFSDRIKAITSSQQALTDKLEALKTHDSGDSDEPESEAVVNARMAALGEVGELIQDLNQQLGDVLDEIFQTNVTETCSSGGTLFDPMPGGGARFEVILSGLMAVCAEAIGKSASDSRERLEAGRRKYVQTADGA
jgi:hypothetical protein